MLVYVLMEMRICGGPKQLLRFDRYPLGQFAAPLSQRGLLSDFGPNLSEIIRIYSLTHDLFNLRKCIKKTRFAWLRSFEMSSRPIGDLT